MSVLKLLKKSSKYTPREHQFSRLQSDKCDLSQSQVAKAIDVKPQTISNWETGFSTPSLDPEQTKKLCSALGVTLDELATAFRGEATLNQ